MSLGYLNWLIQICKHNNNDNLTKNYLQTCLQVRKLANLNHKAVFFSLISISLHDTSTCP